jgi:hypothetical protein
MGQMRTYVQIVVQTSRRARAQLYREKGAAAQPHDPEYMGEGQLIPNERPPVRAGARAQPHEYPHVPHVVEKKATN